MGRKLAESFRGSDIASDDATVAVRPAKGASEPPQRGKAGSNPARSIKLDALESYKAEQRAKVLARVHKHRAKKKVENNEK